MLHLFTRLLPQLVGAERCGIFIHNPHTATMWTKSGTGIQEREIEVPVEGSVAGQCILTNQPVVSATMDTVEGAHRATDAATHFTTRNLLCVPIPASGGTPVGAIQVLNKHEGAFTDEDRQTLQEVARYIGDGIEQFYLSQDMASVAGRLRRQSRRAQRLLLMAVSLVVGLGAAMVMARLRAGGAL
jgi:GAF domain-containing protein